MYGSKLCIAIIDFLLNFLIAYTTLPFAIIYGLLELETSYWVGPAMFNEAPLLSVRHNLLVISLGFHLGTTAHVNCHSCAYFYE